MATINFLVFHRSMLMIVAKNKVLVFCFFLFICFSGCDYVKYAKAIKEETTTKFNANKKFMQRISFNGYVLEKNTCESCQNVYKYRVKLRISKLSEKLNITNIQFNPYYSFENDSTVTISFSKDLYDKMILKDELSKKNNSFNLIRNKQEFQYLSKEKDKWLP